MESCEPPSCALEVTVGVSLKQIGVRYEYYVNLKLVPPEFPDSQDQPQKNLKKVI